MTSAVMEAPALLNRTPVEAAMDPRISDLIDRARNAPAGAIGAWGLSLSTALLLWGAFFPIDFGPLAWIALVPLLMLARLEKPTRRMYGAVFGGGLLFWGASLQWMRLGDDTMYWAWGFLSCYLAFYFPIFLACTRLAVHRLHVPLTCAAPVVWVTLEYLRGHLMTGFSWYLIGHSQHDWTTLIQICDLAGVYGVSFIMLFSAAAVTDLLPRSLFARCRLLPAVGDAVGITVWSVRQQWTGLTVALLLVGAACGYGAVRRASVAFTPGPRVALVQGNFTSEVKHDPDRAVDLYRTHREMTGKAAQYEPDVIVWPETMFPFPLLQADPSLTAQQLSQLVPGQPPSSWSDPKFDVRTPLLDRAEEAGASMIVGLDSLIATADGVHAYNSAVYVEPQLGLKARYDKLHRVPFGEFVPLQDSLPFLASFSPYGPDGGLTAGQRPVAFELRSWRLMPMICFENSVPHLVRRMVNSCEAEAPVDLLVELTNDGWFHESSELDQHLVTALFRCVETRKPLVRAVNTGISALIDGDGVVREATVFVDYDRLYAGKEGTPRDSMRSPETGRFHKGLNAVVIVDVPLDGRSSLYLKYGDWFAAGCSVLTLMALYFGLVDARRRRRVVPPAAIAVVS